MKTTEVVANRPLKVKEVHVIWMTLRHTPKDRAQIRKDQP